MRKPKMYNLKFNVTDLLSSKKEITNEMWFLCFLFVLFLFFSVVTILFYLETINYDTVSYGMSKGKRRCLKTWREEIALEICMPMHGNLLNGKSAGDVNSIFLHAAHL